MTTDYPPDDWCPWLAEAAWAAGTLLVLLAMIGGPRIHILGA